MNIDLYNIEAKSVGKMDLNKDIFGQEPNLSVIHELVVHELANARQGGASTKSRGEVRGGGRKPRPQKGTGRARQGSIRSPQWVGGGVVHGPRPRDFTKKINKKARKLALKSVLSQKFKDNKIVVLSDYKLDTPKTKDVLSFVGKLSLDKPLFILKDIFDDKEMNLYYSSRNIKDSASIDLYDFAAYWLLKYDNIIFTQDAINSLEGILL